MIIKKIFFPVFMPLIIAFVVVGVYLGKHKGPDQSTLPQKTGPRISAPPRPDSVPRLEPIEDIREDSIDKSAMAGTSKPVPEEPSIEGQASPPESTGTPSDRPQPAPSPKDRFVPEPPSAVLPPEARPPMKLCGGESISQCTNVGLTHGDFATLVLDILGLGTTGDCQEAFELLESFQIRPVGGWKKSNPGDRITPREMEEIRCSISIASEDGLILVGPSVLAAAVNRFCEESELTLAAMEDFSVERDRDDVVGETGYQGGAPAPGRESSQVASSPF